MSFLRLSNAIVMIRVLLVCYVIVYVLSQFWFLSTRIGPISLNSNNIFLVIDFCHQTPSRLVSHWISPYSKGLMLRGGWQSAYPQYAIQYFDPKSRSVHSHFLMPHWLILVGLLGLIWFLSMLLNRTFKKAEAAKQVADNRQEPPPTN